MAKSERAQCPEEAEWKKEERKVGEGMLGAHCQRVKFRKTMLGKKKCV